MTRMFSPALAQSTIYTSKNEEAVSTITNRTFRGQKSKVGNSLSI